MRAVSVLLFIASLVAVGAAQQPPAARLSDHNPASPSDRFPPPVRVAQIDNEFDSGLLTTLERLLADRRQRQQPQQSQLSPELLQALAALLQQRQPQPQPRIDQRQVALVQALLSQQQNGGVGVIERQREFEVIPPPAPAVDLVEEHVHQYQLPAYVPQREVIPVAEPPRVVVELARRSNCLSRFLGNFVNMFRTEPACFSCGTVECDCH